MLDDIAITHAPNLTYLEEQDAHNRGFAFNKPEDARKIFRALIKTEEALKGLKKYLQYCPKSNRISALKSGAFTPIHDGC